MNNSIVQVGNFREHANKGLMHPRAVKDNIKTSCVSTGCERGDGGKGMQFSSKDDRRELWGRK